MKVTLGELIKRFRIERGLSAREISKGLCKSSVMSDYENDVKVPDSVMFCYFMERMGVVPEEFAIMVPEKEYAYHCWKEQVLDAIELRKWDEVAKLVADVEKKHSDDNNKLEKQLVCYVKAVLEAQTKGNYARAADYMYEAIRYTIVDVNEFDKVKVAYGTTEICFMILYLYYGIQGKRISEAEGKVLFNKLERYIVEKKGEERERAKVYPKLVCVGIHVLAEVMSQEEKLHLCRNAIDMLRKRKDMYDISELIRIYLSLIPETEYAEIAYYMKHLEVFNDLQKRAGIDSRFRPELLYTQTPKIYVLEEYLHSKRIEKRLTQEELSEGICEPETYSRIENGKQVPKKKKYYALADKLGIGWGYFRGDLYTDDVKMYSLKREHRVAALEERCADSLAILGEMEKGLDMEKTMNYQYVKTNQIKMKYRLGEMTPKEVYDALTELLSLTKKLDFSSKELVYYTQTEVETITYLAQMLRATNRSEEGIRLIEDMLEQMERSRVKMTQQGTGIIFALKVLSGLYFELENYEKSMEILGTVFQLTMRLYVVGTISAILDAYADNLEHIGVRYSDLYKLLYRQSYYVADFFGNENVANFMKKYYEESFGEIVWY